MFPELKGKVVIVTGSAGGIGSAAARLFAACGSFVCLVDRVRPDSIEAAITSAGGLCRSDCVDVTDEGSIRDFVMEIVGSKGRIDVLVNNAGVLRESAIVDTTRESWDSIIAVNLTSVFLFSKAVAPVMIKQNGGCILNAGSFAAKTPSRGQAAYGAAKAGVLNLTSTMAGELAPHNIRVVAYLPGVVRTALSAGIVDKNPAGVVNAIPLGRIAEPAEIANVIVFLASDLASYIDGCTIEVAGGKFCVQNPIPLNGKEIEKRQ